MTTNLPRATWFITASRAQSYHRLTNGSAGGC